MDGTDAVVEDGTTDERFGAVRWRVTTRSVVVGGDAVPDVAIGCLGDDPPARWIPIGTRRADMLTMTVAGRPVALRPTAAGLSRRSYRVLVETTEGPLLMTPDSPHSARLVRGVRLRADNELGSVRRDSAHSVTLTWHAPVRVLGLEADAPAPTPTEAAAGYALALAFGTGAHLVGAALLTALTRLLPG